jgi:hypothetical protein
MEDIKSGQRDGTIDNVRGIAILIYLLGQISQYYKAFFPAWWGHNAGEGGSGNGMWFFNIGFLDFGPALFYFLIGLTVIPSFRKSRMLIGRKAYGKLFYRNFTIIGIGLLAVFITNMHMWPEDWQHLASIGVTGLFTMPFLKLNTFWRGISSVVILILYQIFRVQLFDFLGGSQGTGSYGGMAACIGFAGAVLLVSVLADLYRKKFIYYVFGVAVLWIAAIIAAHFIEIVYSEYSISYLFSTLAAFSTVFGILYLLNKLIKNKAVPILSTIGRNLIFFLLLAVVVSVVGDMFTATLPNLILFIIAGYAVFAAVAFIFEKKKITIKI